MIDTIFHADNPNIYAKVIADSVSKAGDRVTTMEVQCHRFVLAEFNTHRKFSRNSASSRAIPFHKQLERVQTNPAVPLRFRAEQAGMQGGEDLSEADQFSAQEAWLDAAFEAGRLAERMAKLGVHKSIVNRLLEPFLWHRIIVTSTEWENFFALRCHEDAQDEIRAVADCMRTALKTSTPDLLMNGMWHTPYITDEDRYQVVSPRLIRFISAARCARVSYLTHDGIRDHQKDIDLFLKLAKNNPPHDSPLEHVCKPGHGKGNLDGWQQLRHLRFDEKEHAL